MINLDLDYLRDLLNLSENSYLRQNRFLLEFQNLNPYELEIFI